MFDSKTKHTCFWTLELSMLGHIRPKTASSGGGHECKTCDSVGLQRYPASWVVLSFVDPVVAMYTTCPPPDRERERAGDRERERERRTQTITRFATIGETLNTALPNFTTRLSDDETKHVD